MGITSEQLDDTETIVEVLLATPELLQRPLLSDGSRTVIGRPTEHIAEMLMAESTPTHNRIRSVRETNWSHLIVLLKAQWVGIAAGVALGIAWTIGKSPCRSYPICSR